MIDRLKTLIQLKAGGKQAEFARQVGWLPQYLSGFLSGSTKPGAKAITAMLRTYPDINARWLILGDGPVIEPTIVQRTEAHLLRLKALAPYAPFMTLDELMDYNAGRDDFPPETTARWEAALTAPKEAEKPKTKGRKMKNN